jgi:hypothetical protein
VDINDSEMESYVYDVHDEEMEIGSESESQQPRSDDVPMKRYNTRTRGTEPLINFHARATFFDATDPL